MNYKVGDKVRIKSLEWYKNNCDLYGNIVFPREDEEDIAFDPLHAEYCGQIMTISSIVYDSRYIMEDDIHESEWTDEMIEELIEEETKSKFKVGDRVIVRDTIGIWEITNVEDDILYTIKREGSTFTLTTYGSFLTLYEELTDRAFKGGYEKCKSDIELNGFQLPEGYQFVDENGNVINAQRIVLEKKKKEYPKTYEECCKVLGIDVRDFDILYNMLDTTEIIYTNNLDRLLNSFRKLLICRDAYWKIAGEEMGLLGSWKSDFASCKSKYAITYYNNVVSRYSEVDYDSTILVFPTEEMRDVFYENFKKEIEECKELL